MNIEELKANLEGQINITKVVEVKPYSNLIIVCRFDGDMPLNERENLAKALEKYFSEILNITCFILVTPNSSLELDFYRIDPNG